MNITISQCIPGKTKRIFRYPELISKHLHCSICHQVFEIPVRVICGHTFCFACIEKWAGYTKKCPMCKQSITKRKLQQDFIASQLVDQLDVLCSHEKCQWQGKHCTLKKHQRICKYRKRKLAGNSDDKAVQIIDDQAQQSLIMEMPLGQKQCVFKH